MRITTVSMAIAAVLVSGAAAAANVDIYVTGASAQRNFWRADLQNVAACTAAPVTFTWGGNSTSFTDPSSGLPYVFGTPDFSFTTCTAGAAPASGSGINPGDTVTLHYSAELGSVNAIAVALGKNGVAGYPTTHTFLQNGPGCNATTHVCDAGGAQYAVYTPNTGGACPQAGQDAFCGGNPAEIISTTPDITVADIEPGKWSFADNWPNANIDPSLNLYTYFGAAPSAAQIGRIRGGQTLNGQVFAVITHTVPGGDPTNLSRQSLQGIFQGTYTTWNQVPEVGPAKDPSSTAITICRRDHGSGTEVATSLLTAGTECGLFQSSTIVQEDGSRVLLNNTTGNLKTCVNNNNASIGFLSLQGNLPGAADHFQVDSIDGVAVNGHNSAAGYYPYAYETWGAANSTKPVAATFLSRSKVVANLATLGTETVTQAANHQFNVSSGTSIGFYALPIVSANPNTVAGLAASPGVPVATKSVGGESCTLAGGTNGT